LLIVLGRVELGSNSLFAHSVQENDSPTYADPKAGGRVRRGESMKGSFFEEGYASDAEDVGNTVRESVGEGEGVGSECWTDSDGRESLLGD
jgi:hypothetical protein